MAMIAAFGITTYWFWFFVHSLWFSVASIVACAIIWRGHSDFIKANPDMFRNVFALYGLFVGAIGTLNGITATLIRFVI